MSLSHITVNPDSSHEDRAQAIRDTLRDAIVDRRLAPGTKLSEAEVGTLFEVSRTVVRAELQMLAYEGLVKAERNRGAFVSNPTPDEARQVLASRRLIEPGEFNRNHAIERAHPVELGPGHAWTAAITTGPHAVRMIAIDEDWSAVRFRRVEFIKTMNRPEDVRLTKKKS